MSQARNRPGTGAFRLIFNGLHGVMNHHGENIKTYEMIRSQTIFKRVQNSFKE
jgi:hypothetical protein